MLSGHHPFECPRADADSTLKKILAAAYRAGVPSCRVHPNLPLDPAAYMGNTNMDIPGGGPNGI